MAVPQQHEDSVPQPFRLDVQLHDLLTNSPAPKPLLVPPKATGAMTLPEPVFPQHPELLNADDNYEEKPGTRKDKAAASGRLRSCCAR